VEPFALTRKNFQTPLGVVETDVDLVDALLKRSGRDLLVDEFVHRGEHSIELGLVFLQRVAEEAGRAFRIVPMLCGSFEKEMVEGQPPEETPGVTGVIDALREVVADDPRRVMIVVGADLAHVGPRFGGEKPVTDRALADLERVDRETLAHVERGDAEAFYEFVSRDENARNICSVPSIWLTLKVLAPCEAKLLRYEQWRAEDKSSCVTFAACVVS
jgi:AmmeMemoRadiSam system protein B